MKSRYRLSRSDEMLVGGWRQEGSRKVADEVAAHINWLVENDLKHLADSEDGWSRLFVDTSDGRLWELSYDASSSHGGGLPSLRHLTSADASQRYRW